MSEAERFYISVQYLLKVRNFDHLMEWFFWLPEPYRWVFGAVFFGAIYLIYLFLKAALIDNEE